ncbi:hypothetical protein [Shewanella livingstonensis]|uniref:Uncharacterized protein n=1 Tax=Shewanella livingstonensis TaxID=150120 RepID=A0A3G8LZD3_9GAMM|nr:hypothetical protein [Shewanella livingstonensis]AZG74110.1 hypothetical protein EGC82_15930 [Shewanella livingstonensis]
MKRLYCRVTQALSLNIFSISPILAIHHLLIRLGVYAAIFVDDFILDNIIYSNVDMDICHSPIRGA